MSDRDAMDGAPGHRLRQVVKHGTAALQGALLQDPDTCPQPDDHVAALDAEQREELRHALMDVLDIVDNMDGAD